MISFNPIQSYSILFDLILYFSLLLDVIVFFFLLENLIWIYILLLLFEEFGLDSDFRPKIKKYGYNFSNVLSF